MSYENGWAAMNLEMPGKIPRTEYSIEGHWDLLKKVTGRDVSVDSPLEHKISVQRDFRHAWDYGFVFGKLIQGEQLAAKHTSMGHASFQAGGVDFNNETSCPFKSVEEALAFDPLDFYGQKDIKAITRRFEEIYTEEDRKTPDTVSMTGIYITCISGLLEIYGWDMMLTAMGTDPKRFGEITNRYAQWMQQYFIALADTKMPVVMIHDDIVWTSGPFTSPAWYREFVFPNFKKYLEPLREAGKKIIYCSDGNYNEFIDDIADAGFNGFVMEPTTDMGYIAEKYGQTHVIVGNADTRILLYGTKEEIRNEVKRCISIGKKCPGFFMAVGNHIPANTPIDNALYYNEVYEELSQR